MKERRLHRPRLYAACGGGGGGHAAQARQTIERTKERVSERVREREKKPGKRARLLLGGWRERGRKNKKNRKKHVYSEEAKRKGK